MWEEREWDMAMDLDVDGASTGTTRTVEEPEEEDLDVPASSSCCQCTRSFKFWTLQVRDSDLSPSSNSLRLRHLDQSTPLAPASSPLVDGGDLTCVSLAPCLSPSQAQVAIW